MADESSEHSGEQRIAVLVHGTRSSGRRLRLLAEEFESRGYRTLCFDYDDRASMNVSANQLAAALLALEQSTSTPSITVLGHSQGGLVARRAMVQERLFAVRTSSHASYRLVTVAAPFSGISASRDCGRTWLHVMTLGITAGVCQAVAGDKWNEIFPDSDFVTKPGQLSSRVERFVQVVTDERRSCRQRNSKGRCVVDDYVFSLEEQRLVAHDADQRVVVEEVQAGHAGVVGETGNVSNRLVASLQTQGIL